MVIRNWRNAIPSVGHDTKLIWSIFRGKGTEGLNNTEAPLEGMSGLTLHRLQGGLNGDYHDHEDKEQVYYFLSGKCKMNIDGVIYEVKEGDAVHLPPKTMHQVLNEGEDWVEHLLITAPVERKK